MVTVFVNFSVGYDDSGLDKRHSLEEAMASPYSKECEKAIYSEFQSLIEKDT